MSAANRYHFEVVMTCVGCSNAISRVLTRMEPDVSNIEISLEKQTVDVESVLPLDTVLEKIKKTGKEVRKAERL
ncbi:LANO_0G02564g1_1 [Lachancea nothofagi CBS 11611]|uniref:LANO_0G02564g1_1 n=1 Tax=Lachancea nothofagi CBS 11611 TaxID=1266666 RepID=A0A1G4KF32_9SACH|nr:LANO_0G02564g1_1 [Lachancea nothofagi CBS 11611]